MYVLIANNIRYGETLNWCFGEYIINLLEQSFLIFLELWF